MLVRFLNVWPMARSWEAEVRDLTEEELSRQLSGVLQGRPLEFDLEHGEIYSRCERVGLFRVIDRNSKCEVVKPTTNVIQFRRRS